MEQRLTLVTLGVANLKRARRFYEKGLGWETTSAKDADAVFFQIGGSVLGLYPRDALAEDACIADKGSGFGGIVLAHNVRTREEVDAVLAGSGRGRRDHPDNRRRTRSGAAIRAISPIPMVIRGKWHGIRTGPWGRTAASRSPPRIDTRDGLEDHRRHHADAGTEVQTERPKEGKESQKGKTGKLWPWSARSAGAIKELSPI